MAYAINNVRVTRNDLTVCVFDTELEREAKVMVNVILFRFEFRVGRGEEAGQTAPSGQRCGRVAPRLPACLALRRGQAACRALLPLGL